MCAITAAVEMTGCSPPISHAERERINKEIDTLWANVVEEKNLLEKEARFKESPLRETLQKKEYEHEFTTLPWAGEIGGPSAKDTNLLIDDYIIPIKIICASTPKNIRLQRGEPYVRCGIIFPKELNPDGKNYRIDPNTPESQVELNIGNTGGENATLSDRPIIR